jgi:hypothetical protein
MAYTIYNNDGSILLNLPDSSVDDVTTSLYLIGKNVNNYGEYFNNNLVKLLTSFANTAGNEPINPQTGQLFFNKSTGRLTVYNGVSFYPTNGSWLSPPLTPASGDFYFNTLDDQLFIWTGTNYKLVGPSLPRSAGKFGIEPSTATITTDITYVPQPSVGLIYAYGNAIGMVSPTSFKMSTTTSILYLSTSTATQLVSGLTLFQNLDVKGNVSIGGSITATNHYVASGSLIFSGNIFAPAWTTSGIRHVSIPATLTDTSSIGTVATAYTNNFGGNTIAASNPVTFSNYSTIFVNSPTAGANVTITNSYSIIAAAGILVNSTATSISTITGALQVVGGVGIGGSLYIGGTTNMKTYTVATLPAGIQGMRASVSNAGTTTFYSTVSNSGSYFVPVFYDGTNWRIG